MIHFGIPSIYVGSRAGFVEPRGAATSLSLIHPEAIYDIDFANGQWFGALPSDLVVSRASEALTLTAGGAYANFASNTARITGNGLMIEEARTNSIRNPRGSGGTPGTTALPTNWAVFASNGLTTTFVDRVTVQGLPGVRLRISGTSTSTFYVLGFDLGIATTNGLTYTQSLIAYKTAGDWTNITSFTSELRFETVSPFQVFSSNVLANTPTVYTSSGSPTAGGQTLSHSITLLFPSSAAIDITLDIAAPMLRQASFAGSPILNADGVTSSATTQPADVIYLPISGVGLEYTIYAQTAVLASHVSSGALIEAWASSSDRIRPNISQSTQGGSVTSAGSSRSIAAFTAGSGAARKVAMRVQGGNIIVACNGSLGTADTGAAPVVAPSRLYFGSGAGGTAAFLNDELLRGAIIPRALSDAELQALTSG